MCFLLPLLRSLLGQIFRPMAYGRLQHGVSVSAPDQSAGEDELGRMGLLEAPDKVPDRVQALIEQRQIWDQMVASAMRG
jgi:hypothetical protein